jgi:hypothetical protein
MKVDSLIKSIYCQVIFFVSTIAYISKKITIIRGVKGQLGSPHGKEFLEPLNLVLRNTSCINPENFTLSSLKTSSMRS